MVSAVVDQQTPPPVRVAAIGEESIDWRLVSMVGGPAVEGERDTYYTAPKGSKYPIYYSEASAHYDANRMHEAASTFMTAAHAAWAAGDPAAVAVAAYRAANIYRWTTKDPELAAGMGRLQAAALVMSGRLFDAVEALGSACQDYLGVHNFRDVALALLGLKMLAYQLENGRAKGRTRSDFAWAVGALAIYSDACARGFDGPMKPTLTRSAAENYEWHARALEGVRGYDAAFRAHARAAELYGQIGITDKADAAQASADRCKTKARYETMTPKTPDRTASLPDRIIVEDGTSGVDNTGEFEFAVDAEAEDVAVPSELIAPPQAFSIAAA